MFEKEKIIGQICAYYDEINIEKRLIELEI